LFSLEFLYFSRFTNLIIRKETKILGKKPINNPIKRSFCQKKYNETGDVLMSVSNFAG